MPFKAHLIAAALTVAATSSFASSVSAKHTAPSTRFAEAPQAGLPGVHADALKTQVVLVSRADDEPGNAPQVDSMPADGEDGGAEPSRNAVLLAGLGCVGLLAARRLFGQRR